MTSRSSLKASLISWSLLSQFSSTGPSHPPPRQSWSQIDLGRKRAVGGSHSHFLKRCSGRTKDFEENGEAQSLRSSSMRILFQACWSNRLGTVWRLGRTHSSFSFCSSGQMRQEREVQIGWKSHCDCLLLSQLDPKSYVAVSAFWVKRLTRSGHRRSKCLASLKSFSCRHTQGKGFKEAPVFLPISSS